MISHVWSCRNPRDGQSQELVREEACAKTWGAACEALGSRVRTRENPRVTLRFSAVPRAGCRFCFCPWQGKETLLHAAIPGSAWWNGEANSAYFGMSSCSERCPLLAVVASFFFQVVCFATGRHPVVLSSGGLRKR